MAQTREGAIKIFCNRIGISEEFYYEQLSKGLKWCTKCKSWRPRSEFNKDHSRYDGLSSSCVHCDRVKVKIDRKGIPNPMKGKKMRPEVCKKLSALRKGKPQPWKRKPRTDEERRKISEGVKKVAKRGSENPSWKGGKSRERSLVQATFEYQEWRRKVFERDRFVCQDRGYSNGGILEAHHILPFSKYPDRRFDVDNGVTLCKYCHQIRHAKDPTKIETIIRKRSVMLDKNKD